MRGLTSLFNRRSPKDTYVGYKKPGALIVASSELEAFDVPEDEVAEWTRQLQVPKAAKTLSLNTAKR